MLGVGDAAMCNTGLVPTLVGLISLVAAKGNKICVKMFVSYLLKRPQK